MSDKAMNNESTAQKARRIYQKNALEMQPRTKRQKEQSKRKRERLKEHRRERLAGERAPERTGLVAALDRYWDKQSFARQIFVVFVLVPTVLGMLIYFFEWKYDIKVHQSFHKSWETFQVWEAWQHPWCYVLAIFTWFTVIWSFLGERKETHTFLETEDGKVNYFANEKVK